MPAALPPDEAGRLGAAQNHKAGDTDMLTGLYSRRFLDEAGRDEVMRARREGLSLTAAMIDIDKFKTINDTFGPAAGDAVLRAIGQVCKGTVRAPDVVARYGGEELVVLLPGTSLAHAAPVLERMRKAIMAMLVPELLGKWVVTASIGAAELSRDDADIGAVLARADIALCRAKETGRNKVELAIAA